jgi:hypothetical protein
MVTRSSLILVFAIAFTVFVVVPAFLGQPFQPYPSIHWADVFDLLTPLVLIPLYWLLFTDSGSLHHSSRRNITFLILAALWAAGQGMHLSANSINNYLGYGSSGVHDIVHFYDEVLSHYLWHAGIVGLSILLLVTTAAITTETRPIRWGLVAPASLLYGLTFFMAINEGGTVPLGLPAALIITLGILLLRRPQIRTHNLTAFFLVGYLIASILFIGWFIYWGGFPEFTEVGII